MQELAPVIRHLAELVKQFTYRFSEQKRERAIVDFPIWSIIACSFWRAKHQGLDM